MSDVLARICADKRKHVARCAAEKPRDELERIAADLPPPRGFRRALMETSASGGLALVAEIKKASPSKGLIRSDFDPSALARAYRDGGASCLSVLTDRPYFQGDDAYLIAARSAVALPILRKDFTLAAYQIVEARVLGADAVLLIIAALTDREADDLTTIAHNLALDVLVEVHDGEELARALQIDGDMIGINNRNLKTLQVDLAVTERLAPDVPSDKLLVAESGLHEHADLLRMQRAGAGAFLVGESLMRHADVEAATRALLGRGIAA